MPELAEVETWRRLVEGHVLGATVSAAWAEKTDDIVFDQQSGPTVARKSIGRTLRGAHRHGKHLWMEWDQPPHTYVHFGMTGSFRAYEELSDRPRFCKLEWTFDNGVRIGYRNVRRIGRVRLLEDPPASPPFISLGPDPFSDPQSIAWFTDCCSRTKRPIKSLLLDQRWFAGVGNWLADEVLYQAHIAPQRPANSLDRKEVSRLRTAMHRIIAKAVDVEADDSRFPKSWLFHHRWGKSANAATHRGELLQFDTIGGRTTAWVPERQH